MSEGKRTIDCRCPAATCTCGTETFAHDCTQGCTPTADERERCKIPAPVTDDGGGSSSSSSGG
ncbi:MAG TPA: hypothetical protein VM925_20820 [Labilithrix sp.]|nr:hypothetical protein [Labilithrix sp.]